MFRKITNSAPCRQPLQKVEYVEKKKIHGGTRIEKSVNFENPKERIKFDEYSLEDLLATGVKLEQVNTKVIDSIPFDSVVDVPRETTETTEESNQPF